MRAEQHTILHRVNEIERVIHISNESINQEEKPETQYPPTIDFNSEIQAYLESIVDKTQWITNAWTPPKATKDNDIVILDLYKIASSTQKEGDASEDKDSTDKDF